MMALHSLFGQKEEKIRCVERELAAFHVEKFEAKKVAKDLYAECQALKHQVTLYKDDLKIANEVVVDLNAT